MSSSERGCQAARGPIYEQTNRERKSKTLLLLDLWLIRSNVLLRRTRQCRGYAVSGQIRVVMLLPFSQSKRDGLDID